MTGSASGWWQAVKVGIWTLVSGASIGFLIGMSVTPVIQGVITAVLALAVAVITALVGLRDAQEKGSTGGGEGKPDVQKEANDPSRSSLFVAPLGCLLLGIAIGSCFGIKARSNLWLGPSPESFAKTWQKTELGEKELTRRLFEQSYPAATKEVEGKSGERSPTQTHSLPFLFATVSTAEYEQWQQAPDDALPRMMAASHNPAIAEFAVKLQKDPPALRAALGTLIRPSK